MYVERENSRKGANLYMDESLESPGDVTSQERCSVQSSNDYATSWKQTGVPPSGIGNRVRWFLRNTILTTLAGLKTPNQGPFLTSLYCHYVFDDQIAQFEALIVELMKIGTFVTTDECVDMLKGKRSIDGRYFHLSFDDGFRNVVNNAIPVLMRHGVPAIIFVPTSFMGADFQMTTKYCREITLYNTTIELMKWQDLEKLRLLGFEIGSHTKTHARFSAISGDPDFMYEEIAGSKQEIEKRLGIECKYISWPYGKKADSDGASLSMVEKVGYHACFGAFRGSIVPQITNIFAIPRHHFEVQWPTAHIGYFLGARLRHVI